MKTFNQFFIAESILDPKQPTLDPHIFDINKTPPELKPEVQKQILAGISRLSEKINIIDYTLIGSILTRQYTHTSDVDVNLLINEPDTEIESAIRIATASSGQMVKDTQNPIQYHVLNSKQSFDNANDSADAVFELSTNKFIRVAIETPFYVEKYMNKFKSAVKQIEDLKDDLRDDLIDYSELKKLSVADGKVLLSQITKELEQIESDAAGLVDLYDKIKKERKDGFLKPLTAKQIQEYGSKNRLPGNVVYKLLERHYYLQFLEKVEEIVGDDGKVSDKEAKKLGKLVNVSV
jgi:hypothetical protein